MAKKPPIENSIRGKRPDDDLSILNRSSVIATATTGIAALLLIGLLIFIIIFTFILRGGTVHSKLRVPPIIKPDTGFKIAAHTNEAQKFRNVDLIIIDVFVFF